MGGEAGQTPLWQSVGRPRSLFGRALSGPMPAVSGWPWRVITFLSLIADSTTKGSNGVIKALAHATE
jgi:hypothetical protein